MNRVMLPSPHHVVHDNPEQAFKRLVERGWTVETKFDGVRALITTGPNRSKFRIISRSGQDLTERFPDLQIHIRSKSVNGELSRITLDGEIVARSGEFSDVSRRVQAGNPRLIDAGSMRYPVMFVAFDIISLNGKGMENVPLSERRLILRNHAVNNDYLRFSKLLTDHNAFAITRSVGAEGVVCKDPRSTYKPGRTKRWVKIKHTKTASLVVVGAEPGQGSRASTIGSLVLAAMDDREPVVVGKVGSGFRETDLRTMKQLLDLGRPFVVEVEYQSYATDGRLRFPVYKGLRLDQTWKDCHIDQLRRSA